MPVVPRIEKRIETAPTPAVNVPDIGAGVKLPLIQPYEGIRGIETPRELVRPGQPIMPDMGMKEGLKAIDTAITIAQKEKERIDNAIALEMDLELFNAGEEIESTVKDKYKGSNVMGAEDDALQLWRERAEDIRGRYVKNQELAGAYHKVGTQYTKKLLANIKTHTAKELDKYEISSYDNNIIAKTDEAINNPLITEAIINDIKEKTITFSNNRGLGEDWTKNKIRSQVSTIRAGAIQELLNNDDSLTAQVYFNKYKEEIDESIKGQIGAKLKTVGDQQKGINTADAIFRLNSKGALEDMLNVGRKELEGNPSAYNTFVTEINRMYSAREKDIQQKTKSAYKVVMGHIVKAELAGGTPSIKTIPAEDWQRLIDVAPDVADKVLDEMRRESKALSVEEKMAQAINWGTLTNNPQALKDMDLDGMLLKKEIGAEHYKNLVLLRDKYDPVKSEFIKSAIQKIDKTLFDSTDKNKNLRLQLYHKDLLINYVKNNYDKPDYDPNGFVDKILEPIKLSTTETILNVLFPIKEEAELVRKKALQKEVGKPSVRGEKKKTGASPANLREKAIEILRKDNKQITENNINYIIKQLEGRK